jgi:hypothetical protein
MIPSTLMAVGFARQQNIGLDKENLTGSFSYNWTPTKTTLHASDLFNVQFVRNLNPKNYFNVTDLLQGFERNCQRNRRHKL